MGRKLMGLLDNPVTDVIKGLFGIVTDPIKEWSKRKTVKAEGKMEVEKINALAEVAKSNYNLEMAKTGQKIEADWDLNAQNQAKNSWKDEVLMVLLFFPVASLFICSMFYPEKVEVVISSVKALDEFPLWYQIILWGVVAFVFGLRWLIQPLVNKMGNPFKKKENK
jgi:hypothetical protein